MADNRRAALNLAVDRINAEEKLRAADILVDSEGRFFVPTEAERAANLARYQAEQAAKDASIVKMKEILASHGIQMSVSGCGCCGSPSVTFAHGGAVIVDAENAGFDMEPSGG